VSVVTSVNLNLWSCSQLPTIDHIRRFTCCCFNSLRQLRSITRILTTDTIITLVNALVVSRIDYCNAVLAGVHDVHLRQLQRVLNAAARLIARKRKYDSISATLQDALHWLLIRQRVDFTLSVLVFNCLHILAPSLYVLCLHCVSNKIPLDSRPPNFCAIFTCWAILSTHKILKLFQFRSQAIAMIRSMPWTAVWFDVFFLNFGVVR